MGLFASYCTLSAHTKETYFRAKFLSRFQLEGKNNVWTSQVRRVNWNLGFFYSISVIKLTKLYIFLLIKLLIFFQVTSQTFRCCSICTSNRRQITNVKTNWFLTMTVCTETCIVTSTLPYSTLMRLDIINYWFLTTETNLKALYIFRCFLTQPHQ